MTKRRRRRATPPTLDRTIDPTELRFRRHLLVRRTIATATPLDAYVFAGIITRRQFEAGDRLRDIWHRAGRAPKMTADLEIIIYGRPEMTDNQAAAWSKLAKLFEPLTPLHRATLSGVCCFEHGAESTVANLGQPAQVGLLVLRAALEALSRPKRNRAA